MRLFIAAQLPHDMVEALAETSARLRGCVQGRYVAPDSFHVTLAFLGDVEAVRVGQAADALDAACSETRAFEASLGEFGAFGPRAKATLWQGFGEPGALPDLARSVRGELHQRAFTFDGKPFRAHVTLMRAADLSNGVLPSPVLASGRIGAISLFSSDLSGERPVYEPLHVAVLPSDFGGTCLH